ncbi:MAG: DNA recombination protein RmuC [Flavobacteriaceae bacterium]|nr:DNA recombination protein RmuC [Flavobacteriaceae bacterium]
MEIIGIILASLVFGIVGFWLGNKFSKVKNEVETGKTASDNQHLRALLSTQEQTINKAENEVKTLRGEKEDLQIKLAQTASALENLQEKQKDQQADLEKLQQKFQKEFENLAQKILDEKSAKFTQQNKENMQNLLNPLQDKIKTFQEKVEVTHKESIVNHATLKQQILNLQTLNENITKETTNLTKALKGESKTQGNWGELILERVLEKSGLEKGLVYEVQQSMTNEEGKRLQPDVVIHLPDNKRLVIDAKVSLTAYEKYMNEADETQREIYIKSHLISIRKHVEELSSKNYDALFQDASPDFVLMFVPIEPAFAVAVNTDPQLYNNAFDKNIIIVTPTTLLATLRTVQSMWTTRKQQENASEIARQAGALYDKFEGFVTDLIKMGKKMDEAKTEYKNAMSKLTEGRGNLVSSVEKLKAMGAKAKKTLPEKLLERAGDEGLSN